MTPKALDDTDKDVLTWVEQVAVFLTSHYGIALITGRVLGWLMICDPPPQSARQIADAIGASRASLTTSLRFLTAAGFVRRHTHPGERVVRYRMDDDAWMTVLHRRLAAIVSFRDIAQAGTELVGPTNPRSKRMQDARDTFDWLDAVITDADRPDPRMLRSATAPTMHPAIRARASNSACL